MSNWFKDLFVETTNVPIEKGTNTVSTTQKKNIAEVLGASPSKSKSFETKLNPSDKTTSLNIPEELNTTFRNKIIETLDKEDLEGPDMLELFKTTQDLLKEGIELKSAVKTAFIALKSTSGNKIDKKVIDSSYAHYCNVLDGERNKFQNAYDEAIEKLNTEPLAQISKLEAENIDITKQILDLQQKEEKNKRQMESIKIDAQNKTQQLEIKTKSFIDTINDIKGKFDEAYSNTSTF